MGANIFHNSLAIILSSILQGIGVNDMGLRSSRELGGFVLGIGTVIARFHRSGTTPSVMEQLKMSQRGARERIHVVTSAGCHQGQEICFLLSFLSVGTRRIR